MEKPRIEGELESATNSLQPVSLAEEHNTRLPTGGSDMPGSVGVADDIIELPLSELARSESISIEQIDRVVGPVFCESLPIRAGVVIVAVIALWGLAWIAGGSLIPTHVSPSPSVQTVNSSPANPGSNGGRIQALRDSVREASSEASVGEQSEARCFSDEPPRTARRWRCCTQFGHDRRAPTYSIDTTERQGTRQPHEANASSGNQTNYNCRVDAS